ncbi:MAG: Fic family protein [Candidatus Diapherotrites archaeon]|nr:Fic family protein [Candidatus Diapherotrites archaeon]
MFIEVRKVGKNKKYYVAHSFRHEGKVRKIRRYLGQNLTKDRIEKLRPVAEQQVLNRADVYKSICDPFLTVLSNEEQEILKNLEKKADFKFFHLSEEEWCKFSEIFTYNTNAIEGSEITQSEVKQIVEKDKWPTDKTKEDISEIYGVMEAVDYIRKTKDALAIGLIKELHKIVFKNSKSFAGQLRRKGVEVVVRDSHGNVVHQGAPAEKVLSLLKELICWYNKYKKKYSPLVLAAVVHNQFENIHPFADGNGRVGRLLLNSILIKHGLPPVNIDFEKRREYYSALQEYENNHNLRPTIELLLSEYKILRRLLKR